MREEKQPGYMLKPDGSVIDLGLYHTFIESESVHKPPRRPKPIQFAASPTELLGDRALTKYTPLSYNPDPSSGLTIVGPASMFDPLPAGSLPPEPSLFEIHLDLKGKVKGEVINLAQNVAEYRQTCSLFSGLANDIYQTFRSLRRGRIPRGPASWSKSAADRWLEYQYGLKPLLSDLFRAAEDLSTVNPPPVYRRFQAARRMYGRTFDRSPAPYVLTRATSHSWSLRSRVTAIVSTGSIRRASEYGVINPAVLAWELIPYSFVIDWMIPVGDYLSSLDALVGVDAVFCENGARLDFQQASVVAGGGTGNYEYSSVRRWSGFTSDLPVFVYSPSTSFTAVSNGLALLRQLR